MLVRHERKHQEDRVSESEGVLIGSTENSALHRLRRDEGDRSIFASIAGDICVRNSPEFRDGQWSRVSEGENVWVSF